MIPFAIGFGSIGVPELLIVLVIVLLLFGARRLPEVFGAFGKGIRSFREAQREDPVDVTPQLRDLPQADSVADAEEVTERVRYDDVSKEH